MTKFLVVDDDEQNLYMLQVLLRGHGYEVVSAANATEALEKARRDPPAMIISDILMPVMDGFALCRACKQDDVLKTIPFVFYTATYTDPKDEAFALSLGAERFIVKPVEPDRFVEMVRQILEAHEPDWPVTPREPVVEETVYYREYNEALIRKLEDKMAQLEQANQALKREIAERKRAEEALQESEKRYVLATKAGQVGVWDWNLETNEIYVDPNLKAMLGYADHEIRNHLDDWGKLVHPDDTEQVMAAARAHLEGLTPVYEIVHRMLHKDGSMRWFLARGTAIRDANGKPYRVVGTDTDITERKQAEGSLKARARQQAVVAGLGQQALGNVTLSTLMDEAVALVGQTLEVEYCKVLELLPDGEALLLRTGVGWQAGLVGRATVGAGSDSQAGYTLLSNEPVIVEDLRTETRFDGPSLLHDHGVVSGISVIIGDRAQPFGVLGVHTTMRRTFTQDDIHFLQSVANVLATAIERKWAEVALRESEERFRSLVETTSDWVWEMDRTGLYTYASPKVKDLLGYEPEELIGQTPFDLMLPDEAERVGAIFRGRVASQRPFERLENINLHKDGRQVVLETSGVPILDVNGNLLGYRGIDRDITERVQAEERIERLNRLKEGLLRPDSLDEKLKRIAEGVVAIFEADFARIWIAKPGDLCDAGCFHARSVEGPHVCRYRDRCLHLVASSGRYTHTDGEVHQRIPFGCYKIGRMAAGEEAKFITNDVTHDPQVHDHDWARKLGLVSFAGYRLLSAAEEPIGVLALFSQHVISSDEDALLESLANTTAQVIQTARAEEALRQRNRELELLNRAGRAFNSTLELDDVLITVLEEVRQLLQVVACSVWLIQVGTDELVCRQAVGPKSEVVHDWWVVDGQGIADWVARYDESLIVSGAQADPHYFVEIDEKTGLEMRSILAVPLRAKGSVIGVLEVVDTAIGRFTVTDLILVELLASAAATAIENARLYEQTRRDAETQAVLLHEVNHRVKNNLSTILGLLAIERRQAAQAQALAYQALVDDLANRIKGLAQVHSLLAAVQWQPLLLSNLVQQIIHAALSSLPSDKSVSVTVTPSLVRVTPDQAYHLAIIINELTTNTAKHALQAQDIARITVRITLDGDTIRCEFRDDGPGYEQDVLRLERQNVGMYLIQNLVRKGLRGEVDLDNDRGAVTTIRFKAME